MSDNLSADLDKSKHPKKGNTPIDNLLADEQQIAEKLSHDKARADARRQTALAREKKVEEEKKRTPSSIEARNRLLIPNYIRYMPQDMIIKLPLDNSRIKTVALDNYEHVGNATYALTAILPVSLSRAKINEVLKLISEKMKASVIDVVNEQQKYAQKTLKNLPFIKIDELIERSDKPITFKFRSRTPECSKFLNWCARADQVSIMLLQLAHLGEITTNDYYDRVTKMTEGLKDFCAYVYKVRKEAFNHIKSASKKSEQVKAELEAVKKDLKDVMSINLNDDGEISNVKKTKENKNTKDVATSDKVVSESKEEVKAEEN